MNTRLSEPVSLTSLIQQICDDLADAGTGTLAELRRLRPDDPGGPAFWRIVVRHLDLGLPVGDRRDDALRRWAAILRALAELNGLHHPGRRLGTALAEVGVSELRLNKLLRAGGEPLFDEVRTVAHQLATAAVPVDFASVARLVLSDGQPHEQAVRQTIANDYYAQIFRAAKETK
jgi:CRISPR type I-E-associated protein CasB/Cse2